MRKWQVFVSVFSFIVVVGEAKAGDEEEVMAKLNSWYTLLAAGDIDALEMSPHTRFNLNGGLLSDANFKGQI